MAEFSKQYQEAFGFEHSDFDYAELFNDLKLNEAMGQICEGLGTLAVAKSDEGKMLFGVEADTNPEYIKWISLEDAIERAKAFN